MDQQRKDQIHNTMFYNILIGITRPVVILLAVVVYFIGLLLCLFNIIKKPEDILGTRFSDNLEQADKEETEIRHEILREKIKDGIITQEQAKLIQPYYDQREKTGLEQIDEDFSAL